MINRFIFCQDGESPSYNKIHYAKTFIGDNHVSLTGKSLRNEFHLGYGDKYNNTLRNGNINFVGLIKNHNNILFSIPKHYQKGVRVHKLDMILILKSMIKAYVNNDKDYSGIQDKHYIGFPFTNVYLIYKYYKQFGIYQNINKEFIKDYHGKISWFKTIKKSNLYMTHNSPIYLPFIIRDQHPQFNLISYCMDTIIQYTLKLFQRMLPILTWKYTPLFPYKPILLYNKNRTIANLNNLFYSTFNERTKFLIKNIIMFLKSLGRNENHLNIRVIAPFNQVWEDAVNYYLESHTDLINTFSHNKPSFFSTSHPFIKFKHPGILTIGKICSNKRYKMGGKNRNLKLRPDHFLKTNKHNLILFDSKYYKKLDELNMKQVVYQIYFSSLLNKDNSVINSLILPTEHKTKVLQYFKSNTIKTESKYTIWATYLNMKMVLRNYI